jgi:nitroreductase
MPTSADEVLLFDALFSARANRYLKPEPIPPDVLWRLVQAATMAPSGANRQNWRFVILTGHDQLGKLGVLYRARWEAARPKAEAAFAAQPHLLRAMEHLAESIHAGPAVILVGATNYPPAGTSFTSFTNWYGSVFPAVQNLILAARGYGIGATLTTLVLDDQAEIRRLVEAPDDVTFAACLPLGYPEGGFGRPKRLPVEDVAFADTFRRRFERPVEAATAAEADQASG